ncbi:MAG: hypothetical protein E7387_01610 [Ruminococcaceae bacterium]|nr:hypothetical protein [Oscillospiraceae bacterium]
MEKFDSFGKNVFGNYNRECIIRGTSEIIITENGRPILYKVSDNSKFMTSNIFAARIKEYVPQLHSYFLDIGDGEKRALLPENEKQNSDSKNKSNDFCLVQVTSAPRDKKGAQVTTKIRLTGNYVVLLPCESSEKQQKVNISGKIRDASARERLFMLGESILEDTDLPKYSFILRTDSENATAKEIVCEYSELCKLWESVLEKFNSFVSNTRVGEVYGRNPVFAEILRYPLSSYSKICVDTTEMLDKIKEEIPEFLPKLEFVPKRIFAAKSVDNLKNVLMGRKVFLKSGADIVVEKTEALTVIDVNSSKSKLPAHEVNIEAAFEIMRQLRLRDIGGIVICDFIGPEDEKNKLALVEFMRELALVDPNKPEIVGITKLGLVEITRKRN